MRLTSHNKPLIQHQLHALPLTSAILKGQTRTVTLQVALTDIQNINKKRVLNEGQNLVFCDQLASENLDPIIHFCFRAVLFITVKAQACFIPVLGRSISG